ncbi:MAG: alpha/beta hydrolase [Gemmatimonadota bacterium]
MFLRRHWSSVALLFLVACSRDAAVPLAEGRLPVAGGGSLYCRLIGRGTDTVVVVHGGPALNSRYLEEALRSLAEAHVLLFYDQGGQGRSSDARQPDSLSFARDLDDLAAVQAHFALGPMRIVGHHWGAALAAQFAVRHPERVARVVLLSPMPLSASFTYRLACRPNDSSALQSWTAALAGNTDSLDPAGFCTRFWGFQFFPAGVTVRPAVRQLAPAVCDDSPQRIREHATTTRELYLSLRGWNWPDTLGQVSPPALVIVGGESEAWLTNAVLWSARLREARLLVLGRTALFPWAEAKPEINRELVEFLGGSWPAQALRVDTLGRTIKAS